MPAFLITQRGPEIGRRYELTDAPWHDYRAEWGPSPFYDAVY